MSTLGNKLLVVIVSDPQSIGLADNYTQAYMYRTTLKSFPCCSDISMALEAT